MQPLCRPPSQASSVWGITLLLMWTRRSCEWPAPHVPACLHLAQAHGLGHARAPVLCAARVFLHGCLCTQLVQL